MHHFVPVINGAPWWLECFLSRWPRGLGFWVLPARITVSDPAH